MSKYELNATGASVLAVLHDGPETASGVITAIHERFGPFFGTAFSGVHRELQKMMEARWVRAVRPPYPVDWKTKRAYAVTAAGKRQFLAWVAVCDGHDFRRSPTLLRLAFAPAMPERTRQRFVEDAIVDYEADLAAAKANRAAAGGDPIARAIAEFGVTDARAKLKLVRSMLP